MTIIYSFLCILYGILRIILYIYFVDFLGFLGAGRCWGGSVCVWSVYGGCGVGSVDFGRYLSILVGVCRFLSSFVGVCRLLLVVVGVCRVLLAFVGCCWFLSVLVGVCRFFFRVCAYYFIVRARNGKTTFFLGALIRWRLTRALIKN